MSSRPSAAKERRLTRPQREALAMLRRSAEHPSTDTGLLTTGLSIYDAEVDVAWINPATAKALALRGLIEWGEYVGPDEGSYVLHLTEAGRGADRSPDPACDGSPKCPVEIHLHGCFADYGNCDNPSDHDPPPVSAAVSPAEPPERDRIEELERALRIIETEVYGRPEPFCRRIAAEIVEVLGVAPQ